MIVIDEKKIFEIIEKRNPTSVALNGPDGLLHKVQDLALRIGKKFGIPAFVHVIWFHLIVCLFCF